jgi:metal-sulfur cluster biosynthetic enzyme
VIDRSAVDAVLDSVVDPCSNALGEPLGLREMGLATTVAIDDAAGSVEVTMRLTSPCCSYGPMMATAAERELAALPGVRSAVVRIDHGAVWTPAAIVGPAAERLAARRARTLELSGITPYDWSRRP